MTDNIPAPVSGTPAASGPVPLAPGDERTWAMLAHLSVLLNLITGLLGPVAALAVYFLYKERSRYVAYHALQSFVFQLIWWAAPGAILGVMWAITGVLSVVLIGVLLIPFALCLTPLILLMPVAALAYGVWGAIETSQGKDFKYWLSGDWVRGTLTG
jgi:hypothetical protein